MFKVENRSTGNIFMAKMNLNRDFFALARKIIHDHKFSFYATFLNIMILSYVSILWHFMTFSSDYDRILPVLKF